MIEYQIALPEESSLIDKICIFPPSGYIAPGKSQSVSVKFCAIIPGYLDTVFYVKIAHLEPFEIQVKCLSIFPRLNVGSEPVENSIQAIDAFDVEQKLLSDQILSKLHELIPKREPGTYLGINLKTKQKGKSFIAWDKLSTVYGEYKCDFGTVIRNTAVTKVIFIKNVGTLDCSFTIDRKALIIHGITMEFEKMKFLGIGDTTRLKLTMVPTNNSSSFSTIFHINIIGGPKLAVCVIAEITTPQINISSSEQLINFGEIPVGQRKTIFTEIRNISNVLCKWSSKAIEIDLKSNNNGYYEGTDFEIFPSSGTIAPFQAVSVALKFFPQECKTYNASIPLYLAFSKQVSILKVSGKSVAPAINFAPFQLDAGSITPYSESVDCGFTLENTSSFAIDIYSVDHDHTHLEDEEILRLSDSYIDGIMWIPLTDVAASSFQVLKVIDKLPQPINGANQNNMANVCHQENTCVFLLGPPLSGRTTQAKNIASLFKTIYVDNDIFYALTEVKAPKQSNAENEVEFHVDNLEIINEEIVADNLSKLLSLYDSQQGIVFDGIDAKLLSMPLIVKVFLKVFAERGRKIIFLMLKFDVVNIRERDLIEQKKSEEKELAQYFVNELSEDEYENLAEKERNSYDRMSYLFKSKFKELDERRLARKNAEEGNLLRSGEKRLDEENKKSKKILGHRAPTTEKKSSIATKLEVKPGKAQKKTPEKISATYEKAADDESLQSSKVFEEDFSNFNLFKRVDSHFATVDQTLSLIREHDKISHVKSAAEKRNKQSKNDKAVETGPDFEVEEIFAELHEFDVNRCDEVTLFNLLLDKLPRIILQSEKISSETEFVEQRVDLKKLIAKQTVTRPHLPIHIIECPSPSTTQHRNISTADLFKSKKFPTKSEDDDEKFRWILQPGKKKEFIARISPTEVGFIDWNLKFEVAGCTQEFLLPVTGKCFYSNIVNDPKRIFSKWRKSREEKSIISGEFVDNIKTYDFGPLLAGKSRDRSSQENRCHLNIINPCLGDIKVEVSLKSEKSDAFFLEPSFFDIGPGETHRISVLAFPKSNNTYTETLFVCVKDNPEPISFKMTCCGVKPDIEIDKKIISFDKVLIGRKESRDIRLKNPTLIPISWRFTGIEAYADELGISPSEGQICSGEECIVKAVFHSIRHSVFKRALKLEVYDKDKLSESPMDVAILFNAEGYDISIDMHFPKGMDTGLDFGIIRVLDEDKQICILKNKGKYEVGYKFMFDSPATAELFTLTPSFGTLQPSEKPNPIQIIFKSAKEYHLANKSCLQCIIFEPITGEITDTIPISITVSSVFSKFIISPKRDLPFGSLVHGSKASKQFTIENPGKFEFKYSINKNTISKELNTIKNFRGTSKLPSINSSNAKLQSVKRELTIRQTAEILQLGTFTISPAVGNIAPNSKQIINVDFRSEVPGCFEESICIDISDRERLHNDDIEYQITAESFIPGINTTDFASIFEELAVCKRLDQHKIFNSPVYVEDDRILQFGAYLVGQQIQTHLKLTNPFKVPCDISLTVKPRVKGKLDDFAFDIEPKKLIILSNETKYITVSFHPSSIQQYMGTFEAIIDNAPDFRNKNFSFELRGEGTLPRISLEKPITRNSTGMNVLKFRRLLIGGSQSSNIVVKNDGIIPTKFKLEWSARENEDFECSAINVYHTLQPQELKQIEVKCRPSSVRKIEAELRLNIFDNPFEEVSIHLNGEGYLDDFTFEGLSDDLESDIVFSNCLVGEKSQISFKVSNQSATLLRIAFCENLEFCFVPSICFLAAKNDREIIACFSPKIPMDVQKLSINVKVTKIRLPAVQGTDQSWDNRMRLIKWDTSSSERGISDKKIIETFPEPQSELIAALPDYALIVSGFADFSQYETDLSAVIHFKSTYMYQNRVIRFPLKNSGKVTLKYAFFFTDEAKNLIDSPGFLVEPISGLIPVGETHIITLKFSPPGSGEYSACINCQIPNLVKHQQQIFSKIFGTALRPICHFEIDECDKLLAERKINGNSLIPERGCKVLEFRSCGVNVSNLKRFFIVNPTDVDYDFYWKPEELDPSPLFKCHTLQGHISANKKSEISFEFKPETIDVKVIY